jgi:hypothetical protein
MKLKKQAIWNKTGGRCWFCGQELTQMQIDHAVPRVKGGTHDLDNLLPACRPCNTTKKDKTIEEYRTYLQWQLVDTTPFTQSQIEYLASRGIEIPEPARLLFWGEGQLL